MLAKIRQYLIRSKFKRKGLNVIENIPYKQAKAILEDYESQGWEVAPEFGSSNSFALTGKCAIRRGQSTLTFIQYDREAVSISGPMRVVQALAKELELSPKPFPSH